MHSVRRQWLVRRGKNDGGTASVHSPRTPPAGVVKGGRKMPMNTLRGSGERRGMPCPSSQLGDGPTLSGDWKTSWRWCATRRGLSRRGKA